jgi:diguanylate cyclase (GGDEF)-like protein/PAS domain S-box-containing protein
MAWTVTGPDTGCGCAGPRCDGGVTQGRVGRRFTDVNPSESLPGEQHPLPDDMTLYRSIFDRAAVAMSVVDDHGVIVEVNAAFQQFLGFARAEMIGRSANEFSPSDDAYITRQAAWALRAGEARAVVDKRFIRRDGSIWTATLTVSRLQLGDGSWGFVVIHDAITEGGEAEAALQESQTRHRALLDTLPLIVYFVEPRPPYTPVYVSAGISLLGYTEDEWMADPESWIRALHPEDRARVLAETDAAMAARRGVEHEYRLHGKNGSTHWVHDRGEFMYDAAGNAVAWRGIALDMTQQKAAERALRESEARVRGAVEASLDALLIARAVRGPDGTVVDFVCTDANARADAIVDIGGRNLVGCGATELFPVLLPVFKGVLESGKPFEAEVDTTGHAIVAPWIRLQVVPVSDGIGITARDITSKKAAEANLRTLAMIDELTGVHNRRGFLALAEREWQRAARETRGAVLAYIDLNDFKGINDLHGHAEGDRALQTTAEVLRAAFRGADVIGRLGGDEFAVLVVPTGQATTTGEEIHDVERRIMARLAYHLALSNETMRAAGRPYDIRMSIGTAITGLVVAGDASGAGSLASLMVAADEQLYEQKRARESGAVA